MAHMSSRPWVRQIFGLGLFSPPKLKHFCLPAEAAEGTAWHMSLTGFIKHVFFVIKRHHDFLYAAVYVCSSWQLLMWILIVISGLQKNFSAVCKQLASSVRAAALCTDCEDFCFIT